jgi:glycosyl transferase family 25
MMKCLVINLDRSSDRLAHVTAEFGRVGIAFERVAAVDARLRPDLAQMPLRIPRSIGWRLTDSEIACLLSHRRCWEIIARGNDPYCAVFEDDVVLCDGAEALLGDTGWIPADADIVKLETFLKKTVVGQGRDLPVDGFSLSRLYSVHLGTAGYVLSRQAARDLLGETVDVGIPVDHIVFNPIFKATARRNIYQMVPALCLQDQFLSERAVGLPSLLRQERLDQWLAGSGKPRKTLRKKLTTEIQRLAGQIHDALRSRKARIIPFDYRGKRVQPHIQYRENAL